MNINNKDFYYQQRKFLTFTSLSQEDLRGNNDELVNLVLESMIQKLLKHISLYSKVHNFMKYNI